MIKQYGLVWIAHNFCCNSNRFEPLCQGATPPAVGIRCQYSWRLSSSSLADRLSSGSGRRGLLTSSYTFSRVTKPSEILRLWALSTWLWLVSQNVHVSRPYCNQMRKAQKPFPLRENQKIIQQIDTKWFDVFAGCHLPQDLRSSRRNSFSTFQLQHFEKCLAILGLSRNGPLTAKISEGTSPFLFSSACSVINQQPFSDLAFWRKLFMTSDDFRWLQYFVWQPLSLALLSV